MSLTAISIGYGFPVFFGCVVSTRAINLYLYIMHGRTVIASKETELGEIAGAKGHRLELRRQAVYFAFILAVVVSFGHVPVRKFFPTVSPVSKPTDLMPTITPTISSGPYPDR